MCMHGKLMKKNLVLLYLEQLFNKIPKFFTMV